AEPFRAQVIDVVVKTNELCGHPAHIRCKCAQPARLDSRIEEKHRENDEGRSKVQHPAHSVAPRPTPADGLAGLRNLHLHACEVPGRHQFASLYFFRSAFTSSAAFSSSAPGSPPSYTASQASGRYSYGLTPERAPRVSGESPASLTSVYAVSIAGISSMAWMRVSSSHAGSVTGKYPVFAAHRAWISGETRNFTSSKAACFVSSATSSSSARPAPPGEAVSGSTPSGTGMGMTSNANVAACSCMMVAAVVSIIIPTFFEYQG